MPPRTGLRNPVTGHRAQSKETQKTEKMVGSEGWEDINRNTGKALRREGRESNETDPEDARVKAQGQSCAAHLSASWVRSIRLGTSSTRQHKPTYLLALDIISPEACGEAQVFGQRVERLGFLVEKPHLGG